MSTHEPPTSHMAAHRVLGDRFEDAGGNVTEHIRGILHHFTDDLLCGHLSIMHRVGSKVYVCSVAKKEGE